MRIESEHVVVICSVSEVFEFLNDMNNFEQLLPPDKYSNWQSSNNQCSFKVQSATIDLIKKETTTNETITLVSGDKAPFPYTLTIYMSENDENTKGYLVFEGEVNQFLKMMVEKPLANLFNYMAKRLVDVKSKP